jgi:gamma-glutamyltranspeptidase/glutathione hydrolase
MRIFRQGGNAVDAGVAAGIALGVVERDLVDFAGVAPIMLFRPGMTEPLTIDGLGRWPRQVDFEGYITRYGGEMPVGIARSVTPGSPASWLTALADHGTLTLSEVLEPAMELAEGFPVFPRLSRSITQELRRLRQWPSSAEVFLPDGRVPEVGQIFRQPDLRRLLEQLVGVADAHHGCGRSQAIRAAQEFFYHGDPARRIADFMAHNGGHLTLNDLREVQADVSKPVHTTYRGIDVYACGPWSQGPVVPLALNIMEFEDLAGLEPEHPRYLHACAEALKLALADREAYFGDPDFVAVPVHELLDKRYAGDRHALLADTASVGLPEPGDPWFGGEPGRRPGPIAARPGAPGRDTAYVATMDAEGNAFSATPSDSGLSGPIVPGLGIVISTRGSQFHLERGHPAVIAPGKRPRLTPNPAMLMQDGKAILAFGCPGGDAQTQAMVQVASRLIDFGLSTQEAIELPRIVTLSAPDSFYPHGSEPGVVLIEDIADQTLIDGLRTRGHTVRVLAGYSRWMGAVCAIRPTGQALEAGADPRRDCMAAAW